MNVRQGFVADATTEFREAAAFAGEHGFDFLELNMENAYRRDRLDAEAVRAAADEHDLALLAHLPYRVDPGSPHDHARNGACRELEVAIDAADDVGAEKAVFHAESFVLGEDWDHDRVRAGIYDSVRRIDDYAREKGIEAVVENLKGPFVDAGDFPELFAETGAAMCLDTGHAHATGHDGAWQASLLRESPHRISHVHLNDTRRDDDDEHLPVGLGHVDFEALAAAMADASWTGTVTHELYGFDLRYAATSKRAFEELLADATG